MTDFNSALPDQIGTPLSPLPSANAIAAEIVRRDQRRTRFLAVLCLVFWILGAAGMALLVTGINEFVMGVRLRDFRRTAAAAEQPGAARQQSNNAAADNRAPPGDREPYWDDGTSLLHHSLPYIDGSLVALLLAAISTVLLVFSSRRTTLNRINISLAQISEQLKQMARPL